MTLPMLSGLLDLNGPAFLVFYAAAFAATLLLGRWMKRHLTAAAQPLTGAGNRLSAYELASLAGGPERAIATALARLSHQGVLAPAGEGQPGFVVQRPLPAQAHELEQMLHREVALRRDSTPPSLFILSRLTPLNARPLEHIDATLMREGWLVDPAAARARWVRGLVVLLWLGLIALGLAKIGVGLSRDKPVVILVFFVIVSVLTAWFTRGLPRLTPRGEEFLNGLIRRNDALRTTLLRGTRSQHNVSHEDLLLAVALFGTTVLADGPLAWMLPPRQAGTGTGTGDAGSSSSSCGGGGASSCGGGGGGCGGCGGGGCS